MDEKIDTNLYSRQIGTIGMEAMKKLIKLKILIVGLRGLGIEIAKNIILAGPNKVSIFDPEFVNINDLGSNFYLTNEDIKNKRRRDEACIKKLSELNSYVECDIMEGIDIFSKIKDYNVLVITEIMNKEKLFIFNEECRKKKIGFIYAANIGITGFCFVDFGEHTIIDKNGEENKTFIIKKISNNGEIFIDKTVVNKNFNITKGNYVIFREIEGLTELNDGKPRQIVKSTPISFYISDSLKYENYISGGICEEVKESIVQKFYSLKNRFYIPYTENNPNPFDLTKVGRGELIHCGILALHEFYEKYNNSLPEQNNSEMSKEILEISKKIYNNAKKDGQKWSNNIKTWNDKIITNIANWAKCEITPVCSFLGGIVAQEIVKFTGKYTPINQWFWCEFSEIVENLSNNIDRTLKNNRYDDQIAIFGNEIQNKLSDLNIFMIGAGALGCEFLKNFALMGIAINDKKEVIITDNDNIEFSNLNRQFLFRKKDIGKSKSQCACKEAKKINPNFNCIDKQSRIGPENEHIFNEKFWDKQTCVINAVDNIEARKYIDKQCTFYEKPLFDSGTLGTKAHIQTIIPHITCCYNDNKKSVENNLNSIPMCTLHNFPAIIEHCIEWGRELFNLYFTENIIELKNWAENREIFYEKLKNEDSITIVEILSNIKRYLLIIESKNFDKCIEFAVNKFTENFDYKINQLISDFPRNFLNKDGSKFWSGSKRFPHPIKYNADDDLSFSFVKNFSIILANILEIHIINDDEYIKKISNKIEIPPFIAKNYDKKNENIDNKREETDYLYNYDNIEELIECMLEGTDDKEIKKIKDEINKITIDTTKINPEKFDKDNDLKGHIDFIFSCSTIRARNYNIKEIDKQKLKMIAGKIVPSLATTTAAITGIVCLQLYTLIQTNQINYFKNCYLNLAINRFLMTKPSEKIKYIDKEYDEELSTPIKAIPLNWTVWDKIIINGSKTPKELIDYIKNKYNVDTFLIISNGIKIYQTLLPTNNDNNNLKIEEIYKNKCKDKNIQIVNPFLVLQINGEYNKIPVLMPLFKYNYLINN